MLKTESQHLVDKPRGSTRSASSRCMVPGTSLGLAATDTTDLIRQVEHGLSFKALQMFAANSGLAVAEITSVVGIPERTLARRKAAAKLTPNESERLVRVATVFDKAIQLFEGDVTAAVKWLTSPKKGLNDRSPLDYCRTELGAREVENLIGRLEHGVFS